jgi:hypothetical protein
MAASATATAITIGTARGPSGVSEELEFVEVEVASTVIQLVEFVKVEVTATVAVTLVERVETVEVEIAVT